jgi:methionyl-tRNA formyltransferase
MRITILCSSSVHPVNEYLERWVKTRENEHEIELVRCKADLRGGDILFLISCSEILSQKDRNAYDKTFVIHASDLPKGRGWSPHIWQIIEGSEVITVTLLEAEDKLDSGEIWYKMPLRIPPDALWNEINHLVFEVELGLMDYAVDEFYIARSFPQESTIVPTYYSKRTPEDSRIDPEKSIKSQFDLIRVSDPVRYPAFFELYDHKYIVRLEKTDE